MKIQIRKGTFETNSSSMHSLVITNEKDARFTTEEMRKSVNINSDGVITLSCYDMYFGNDFGILSTFGEKLRYYLPALCCSTLENPTLNRIKEVVKKCIPEFTDFNFTDVDNDHICGYVEDSYMAKHINTNEKLYDLLTLRSNIIIVDGDGYCIFNDFVKSPLCNTETIVSKKNLCVDED